MPLALHHPALFGAGPRGAWLTLRALQTVHERGWARYVGPADRMAGHHVLHLAGTYRGLHRAELVWWGRGLAAGHGQPNALDHLHAERVPQLLTAEQAADRLGITTSGVRYYWRADLLYPIYVVSEEDHRVRRLVFARQVDAIARGTGAAEARWRAVRELLPDQPRLDTLSERVVIADSPDLLPVAGLRSPQRQREALALGVELGWLSGFAQAGPVFAVTVAGVECRVPVRAVEPWLLGVGDAHEGQGRRVAYRDGLG